METILSFSGKNSIQQIFRITSRLLDKKSIFKEIKFDSFRGYFNCFVIYDRDEIESHDFDKLKEIASEFDNPKNYFNDKLDILRKKLKNRNKESIKIVLIDDIAEQVYRHVLDEGDKKVGDYLLISSLQELKEKNEDSPEDLSSADLILLDIDFSGPESDHRHIIDAEGFDILDYIKKEDHIKDIPIVMFSDYDWDEDDEEIINTCWKKGANGFYSKEKVKSNIRFLIQSVAYYLGKEFIITLDFDQWNDNVQYMKRVLSFFQSKFTNLIQIRKTERNRLIMRLFYYEEESINSLYYDFWRTNNLNQSQKERIKFNLADIYKQMHTI